MKKITVIFLSIFCLVIVLAVTLAFSACASSAGRINPAKPEWSSELAPEMVLVPGGSFRMGSENKLDIYARPVHTVSLNGFHISRYQVTQKQYHAVMGYNPSQFQGESLPKGVASGGVLPVEMVSWFDVVEFCNKLSELEGLIPVYTIANRIPKNGYPIRSAEISADWSANGYRLPTEAEWEYAAKDANNIGFYFTYSGSDSPNLVAWYHRYRTQEIPADTSFDYTFWENVGWDKDAEMIRTYPVGSKQPNRLGIYDMSGNVWEWCWDWFDEYLDLTEADPKGPPSGVYRVRRGGSSFSDLVGTRVAYRENLLPLYYNSMTGFRVVRGHL